MPVQASQTTVAADGVTPASRALDRVRDAVSSPMARPRAGGSLRESKRSARPRAGGSLCEP